MASTPARAHGVGTRLLLAVFGISAFSALVACAAIYAFYQVGQSLVLIDRRIDPMLASLEVSRSVERIGAASSTLFAVNTEQERSRIFAELSSQSRKLHGLLNTLRDGGISYEKLTPIEEIAVQVDANLTALDADVRLRLQLIGRIKELMRSVFDTNQATQRLLSPTFLVYDSQITRLISLMNPDGGTDTRNWQVLGPLVEGLLAVRQVQRVQQQTSDVADGLAQASIADQKQRLVVIAFQLRRKVDGLEKSAQTLDPKLRPLFLAEVEKFKTLIDGASSITQLRQQELELIGDAKRLLAENARFSPELTAAAEQLLEVTKREVREATGSAFRVQRISTEAIAVLVALSLLTSILIVWRYVGRNIVARLNRLSTTMLAIADGDRNSVVTATGTDEIAQMGRAVETFRQNAIALDELLIERAAAADRLEGVVAERTVELGQQQAVLRVTFDNMADGVVRFDEELRLTAWNRNFATMLALPDAFLAEARSYSDYLHFLAERGEFGTNHTEAELRRYRENIGRHYAFERTRPDGRVLEIHHNPVPGGGFVLIYSDITERKRAEEEIRAARDIAATDAYVTSRRERKKVEMLFAHLKRILKLDRLRLRGPNGARDEFHLAATAQNLRKLAKLIPMPEPTPA